MVGRPKFPNIRALAIYPAKLTTYS